MRLICGHLCFNGGQHSYVNQSVLDRLTAPGNRPFAAEITANSIFGSYCRTLIEHQIWSKILPIKTFSGIDHLSGFSVFISPSTLSD